MRKGKEKKKQKRKGKREKKERKKTVRREKRKEMRKKERERKDFPAFRWSKFDSPTTKVGARKAIYVWTPKSWSFDKLHEVGYFPTWLTFSLKAL